MTFANVNGNGLTGAVVHVPGQGAWFADVDFEEAPDVSGSVTLNLGDLALSGTVDARYSGTFALRRRARIVGGVNGWGKSLPAKAYHNDAGIRAQVVAEDAAREAGETLGTFTPVAERIGVDYVRSAGVASRALEDVIGGPLWWIGYDGKTNVGPRSTAQAQETDYEVLDYDAREQIVVLAVDDLRKIGVGSIITARLDAPLTINELAIEVTAERVRVKTWCGGALMVDRIAAALRRIVARDTDAQLFGKWRYRVIQMSGDRVELQAVRAAAGLPNILPISMAPGVAGVHSMLTPGSECLVEFIEGNRTQPFIAAFAGKDGNGFVPVETLIDATTMIKLGDGATSFVALATKVNAVVNGFLGATPVANDGGAALQAATQLAWTAQGSTTAATKVKAL